MTNLKHLTDANFEEEVEKTDGLVLVDFWAPWCGPCQMLGPTIEELASEFSDKVKVCKVNVDENPQVATKYGITGIPAVFVFKDGKVVEQIIGYRPKDHYIEVINKYINE